MRWTEKEINVLKELAKNGLTFVEISKQLNRSINSIRTKAQYIGVTSLYKKRKLDYRAIWIDFQNMTAKEVGKKYNIHHKTVSMCVQKYQNENGLKSKDGRRKDEWSVEDLVFLIKNAGKIEREHIGEKLKRGKWRVIKEKLQRLNISNSRCINGLPFSMAIKCLNIKEDIRYTKIKLSGKGKFRIVVWNELLKYNIEDPIIKKCIETMDIFCKWIIDG